MAQTSTLLGASKVPTNATAALTAAVLEWNFSDTLPPDRDYNRVFRIRIVGDAAWLFGTANASSVTFPVAAGYNLDITVANGQSIFVKAATTANLAVLQLS